MKPRTLKRMRERRLAKAIKKFPQTQKRFSEALQSYPIRQVIEAIDK